MKCIYKISQWFNSQKKLMKKIKELIASISIFWPIKSWEILSKVQKEKEHNTDNTGSSMVLT